MNDINRLLENYLKTEYRVQTAGGVNVLRIDQASNFLERAHKLHLTDRSAFITACNPASQLVSGDENEAAMEQMNEEVSERWPKYFAEGADPSGTWPPEASYLVMGIDYRDVIELAHKYNQNAFLYAYKEPVLRLYYRDNSTVPDKFPYGYKPYFAPDRKVEPLHVNFVAKRNMYDLGLSEKAMALIGYIKDNEYVCPTGKYWDGLWKLLPDKGERDTGWRVPPPLILSGWHNSDHHEKAERFARHLLWADEHKVIDQVDGYLRGLSDDAWLKLEEAKKHTQSLQEQIKPLSEK